jgi:hypothetical protein
VGAKPRERINDMKVAHEAFEITLENNFGDTYMDIEYD